MRTTLMATAAILVAGTALAGCTDNRLVRGAGIGAAGGAAVGAVVPGVSTVEGAAVGAAVGAAGAAVTDKDDDPRI